MSDQRPDDETLGRALGRAVETQSVRETPYTASRLAARIDRPARGGWLGTLAAAAALGLFVAMGAFLAGRGQGVATPDARATPTVSATSGPSLQPTAVPSSCAPELTRVFFARDRLPPVAGMIRGSCGGRQGVVDQIGDRLTALLGTRLEDLPPGAFTATGRASAGGRQGWTRTSIAVDGDLATVEIGVEPAWAARGAAQSEALVQQLIYTITEVPGIRRVWLKDPGKQTFTIDQLVIDKPLSRENVAGYKVPADKSLTIDEEQRAATATTTVSNEVVAPALGRLAIELRPTTPVSSGFWSPFVKAELLPTIPPSESKWALAVTLLGVTDPRAGSLVGAGSLSQVEGSPIRALRVRREVSGVTYEIFLDDARPWRIGLQRGTNGALIVLVDIGGPPSAITTGTAVYTPVAGATVGRSVTVSGLARAFEATVSWRVRDSSGREVAESFTNASIGTSPYYGTFEFTTQIPASVSGNVTLDVFQASPRDGSDTSKVSIPLQVR